MEPRLTNNFFLKILTNLTTKNRFPDNQALQCIAQLPHIHEWKQRLMKVTRRGFSFRHTFSLSSLYFTYFLKFYLLLCTVLLVHIC